MSSWIIQKTNCARFEVGGQSDRRGLQTDSGLNTQEQGGKFHLVQL